MAGTGRWGVVVGLLLAVAAGCRGGASGPRLVSADGRSPERRASGVNLVVHGSRWRGQPERLARLVTPVRVTIENASGRPVRLLYRDLALRGSERRVYRPIPPIAATRLAREGGLVVTPSSALDGFDVAPYLAEVYPTLFAWQGPFPYDAYVERQYDQWPEGLPSADVLAQAIPEGVIADGGSVTGWLFFPLVTDSEQEVVFAAEVVDGHAERAVAELSVPLRVR